MAKMLVHEEFLHRLTPVLDLLGLEAREVHELQIDHGGVTVLRSDAKNPGWYRREYHMIGYSEEDSDES